MGSTSVNVNNIQALEMIYGELAKVLALTNFSLNRKKEGFIRQINGGWQEIGVPFYPDRFEFSLVVTIRLDAVERISHMFSGSPLEYHSDTVSTIIQLEHFTLGPTEFAVTNAQDIQNAIAVLEPVIHDRILPFLEKHQDIVSLDCMLNRCIPSVDTSFHPYRGMSAIIAAKMAGNPEFERLVAQYANEMNAMPTPDREKFNRLAEYLKADLPATF